MAEAAIAMVAGSSLQSATTLGASLGAASIQSNTAKETNLTNLDFQQSMIERGEKSFTDAGLPKFMYWGGMSGVSPNSLIHLGGSNFYEQSGVNANLPYFSPSGMYDQWNHVGKPRSITSNVANSSTQPKKQGFVPSSEDPMFSGQTDRVGLGAGRYSAVPPPTLTYNSVGTGTNVPTKSAGVGTRVGERSFWTQTGSNTRDFWTQAGAYTSNTGSQATPRTRDSYTQPFNSYTATLRGPPMKFKPLNYQ